MTAGRACVFFDRDGVVNESPGAGYVQRPEDLRVEPGFVRALAAARVRGYEAVVVTNQSCVARGIVPEATVQRIHDVLRRELRERHGLGLLDIIYCPHDEGQCDCRKPRPGMLLAAARRHGLDLARSWMVGDQPRDIEAGRRAGCRTIFVGGGGGGEADADHVVGSVNDLEALFEHVLT
jgi:D-glycero-D-manno-heptose 1,7-bisphosphate phosphatase